jgi:hypothetical protein
MPLYKNRSFIVIAVYFYLLTNNRISKYMAIALTRAAESYSLVYGPRLLINKYSNSSRLKLYINRQTKAKYYIKT